jgi:type II secretory ATPase GspE/PulE/Tfp pilus assembly ATPase PilB-like protein
MVATSPSKTGLAELLVAGGVLTEPQLELALREQRRSGKPLRQVLVQLGMVSPDALAEYLAKEAQVQAINLNHTAIDPAALRWVPLELAQRCQTMPVTVRQHALTVALADPFDLVAIDTLHQATGLDIEVVTAPERDILNCQEYYYAAGDSLEESIDRILAEQFQDEDRSPEPPLSLGDGPDEAPIIHLVSQIIHRAIHSGASDIHFEPEEKMMRIRTRVDGILYQEILIPKAMQSAITTRVKIMADLDLAESRIPQDGRATIPLGGRQVNLRVSSLPTSFGENLVARILDPKAQVWDLPALGFAPDTETSFREAINKPYGIVLVTGPTGSGKTTTLYAVLREVSTMDVSTFTLEDPIEYRMGLVRQTQIKEEIGLTFGNGLRALLRQDPDIILVGETRDTETAQLMVRAALTGHLVFSSLHTNDAAGAIPRLLDMGVEPFLLPVSLVAVLAQRLVRTICPNCKTEIPAPEQVFAELKVPPPSAGPGPLWRGAGCPECMQTGYRGRRGIYELMQVDERFHDPMLKRAGAAEFVRLARAGGMRTMFEDGLLKTVQGLTTIEELLRVTRLTG